MSDGIYPFHESRAAIRRQLLLSIFLLLFSIGLALVGAMGDTAMLVVLTPVAALLFLFELLGIYNAIRRAVRQAPRLTMSAEGIRDHDWGDVLIPWTRIKDIRYYSIDDQMIVHLENGVDVFPKLKHGEVLEPSNNKQQPTYLTTVEASHWSPEDFQQMLKCAQALHEKHGLNRNTAATLP